MLHPGKTLLTFLPSIVYVGFVLSYLHVDVVVNNEGAVTFMKYILKTVVEF